MDRDTESKIAAVRLVAMDVDGVLTDGRAFYGSGGVEGVLFNVHDGTGIKWLQRAGIETALISGRDLEAVNRRETGLGDEAICYVGDDLPDLPVMRRVGLAVAVPNARPQVRALAHIVTRARGGEGAVRELAELILKAKGLWEGLTGRYFDD